MPRRPARLAYNDPCGSRRLRMALQAYLWRSRTVRCEVDQIIIVNGSQQGLDLCARLLLNSGDRFVMEDPGYLMARHVFSATGAAAVPIPVDVDGLDTERLANVQARLAYVTPSHQFPLGGVMPIARRHQLLAWARKFDAYVNVRSSVDRGCSRQGRGHLSGRPLFNHRHPGRRHQPDVIGLVMGYAALEARQIERGCQLLAQAVDQLRSRRLS
nr:PLP-dependent aminotransferase family protein [Bradyrhizobium retamae]